MRIWEAPWIYYLIRPAIPLKKTLTSASFWQIQIHIVLRIHNNGLSEIYTSGNKKKARILELQECLKNRLPGPDEITNQPHRLT
jgi:hypothetical protein